MRTLAPDFTPTELHDIAAMLQQRYGAVIEPELADCELLLDPAEGELTVWPTVYWSARGAQFAVFKVADSRYRCQFIYTDADHYGTGRDQYDSLSTCVLTLPRVQADQQRDSAVASSGATAADLLRDDYQGPAIL